MSISFICLSFALLAPDVESRNFTGYVHVWGFFLVNSESFQSGHLGLYIICLYMCVCVYIYIHIYMCLDLFKLSLPLDTCHLHFRFPGYVLKVSCFY